MLSYKSCQINSLNISSKQNMLIKLTILFTNSGEQQWITSGWDKRKNLRENISQTGNIS